MNILISQTCNYKWPGFRLVCALKNLDPKSQMAISVYAKLEICVNKEKCCVINFVLDLCYNLLWVGSDHVGSYHFMWDTAGLWNDSRSKAHMFLFISSVIQLLRVVA